MLSISHKLGIAAALPHERFSPLSESKRKVFTGEQKAKVAIVAVKGTKTINEIAQEHGVHPQIRQVNGKKS